MYERKSKMTILQVFSRPKDKTKLTRPLLDHCCNATAQLMNEENINHIEKS